MGQYRRILGSIVFRSIAIIVAIIVIRIIVRISCRIDTLGIDHENHSTRRCATWIRPCCNSSNSNSIVLDRRHCGGECVLVGRNVDVDHSYMYDVPYQQQH